MLSPHAVTIECTDDIALSGLLYKPLDSPVAAVMIAPATGIKQGFYTRFATFLAEQGIAVSPLITAASETHPKPAK